MAVETVVAPEFRCPNEDTAWRLFERLQALAEELGVELTHAGVVAAPVYDDEDGLGLVGSHD
jgi:hypothetical protein